MVRRLAEGRIHEARIGEAMQAPLDRRRPRLVHADVNETARHMRYVSETLPREGWFRCSRELIRKALTSCPTCSGVSPVTPAGARPPSISMILPATTGSGLSRS